MSETVSFRMMMSDGTSGLEPGLHITFDDGPVEDCTWHGPYTSHEAAHEAAVHLLKEVIAAEASKFFSTL